METWLVYDLTCKMFVVQVSILTLRQMVDLRMSNEKLRDRARRVIRAAVPSTALVDISSDETLDEVLAQCDGRVKLGILITILGCSPKDGEMILEAAHGSLRMALELEQTLVSTST